MNRVLGAVVCVIVVGIGCDDQALFSDDAGVVVLPPVDDAGAPSADGGAGPTDGGASPGDGGTAPTDGGPAPPDAGQAPVDGGVVPETDGGALPGDDVDVDGWVAIDAGTFMMGSPDDDPCRNANETLHQVTLTRSFLIDPLETTRGDFATRMGYDPSSDTTSNTCTAADCPVNDVNWHMAAAYCNALSIQESLTTCYDCAGADEDVTCAVKAAYTGSGTIYDCPGIRLPTDAEWEYAYRAGTTTSLYNGDLPTLECQDTSTLAGEIGWYIRNTSGGRQATGGKTANGWGLLDMAGNVAELVNDFYVADLGAAAVTDPVGGAPVTQSLIRGGSFAHHAENLRGAFRQAQTTTSAGTGIGFRCVRTNE